MSKPKKKPAAKEWVVQVYYRAAQMWVTISHPMTYGEATGRKEDILENYRVHKLSDP